MSQDKITDSPKNFGERLRWFRNLRNISQADLGKAVARTGTSISEWEKGATEPSMEQIKAIAEKLGISAARLAFGEVSPAVPDYRKPGNQQTIPLPKRSEGSDVLLDPRFQPRAEPTPQMCHDHFNEFLARAEREPGGVGFTWRLLQKHFPLDEFEPKTKAPP